MPRLSLWRPNKGNDYKFFDRRISELFTVGGTDVNIHKYLGPIDQSSGITTTADTAMSTDVLAFANAAAVNLGQFVQGTGIPVGTTVIAKDASTVTLSKPVTTLIPTGSVIQFYTDSTSPPALNNSALNIQDLLFLENRDRKYDTSIYTLRTLYRVNDNDFDLSQFGLFLTGDTLFMLFHLIDMVETIGRKIMVGDVLELPHLADYYPLNSDLPSVLKRFYVVNDANRAAEGMAPTWFPHLWRVKVQPLVDSQEYKDIINQISNTVTTDPLTGNTTVVSQVLSTYDKFIAINDAIIDRAQSDVPKSGYDTSWIYTEPVDGNGLPGDPGQLTGSNNLDASTTTDDTSDTTNNASNARLTPDAKVEGYLTGDGLPPNGMKVNAGIAFPSVPVIGDYYLRLDYVPNRLFRFDGKRWVKIEDSVRTNLTPGAYNNTTQINSFTNNYGQSLFNPLAYDAVRVAVPYNPPLGSNTMSFDFVSKTIVTQTMYNSNYGVKTLLNGRIVTNTLSNSSGNVSITLSDTIKIADVIEYTIYGKVIKESQSLSQALRPSADN